MDGFPDPLSIVPWNLVGPSQSSSEANSWSTSVNPRGFMPFMPFSRIHWFLLFHFATQPTVFQTFVQLSVSPPTHTPCLLYYAAPTIPELTM